MRPVRFPFKRWRGLFHELAKFGTIGVVNLIVNFAVFNLLILTVLADGQLKAKAAATVVATTCAYFMNRHWTYRDRPRSTLHREYTLFFFFNLVGLVIEVAVVGLAKYGLEITHLLALNVFTALGIGLGTIFRFWAYRTHVFRPESAEAFVAVPAATVPMAFVPAAAPGSSPELDDERLLDAGSSDEIQEEIELDGIVALADETARTKR